MLHYCAPAHREGGNKRCFCPSVCLSVHPSVHPSVMYVVNNLRTQRPGVPKFGSWRFPNVDAICIPVSRSKVKVTWSINADTHRAPYLPNGKAYELQTWYTDGGRRPASATSVMISKVNSKVKVARSCDQSEPSWPNAVIRGQRGHTVSAATILVIIPWWWHVFSLLYWTVVFVEIWSEIWYIHMHIFTLGTAV